MKNCICRIGFKGARRLAGRITLLLLLAGAALWSGQPLHAASRQWTGDDSGLWSDPDNWFPVGVPQNGDSLTFPAVGPLDATSMVNDLTGLTVDSMTFTAGGYALNGNALTFIQGITDNHAQWRAECGFAPWLHSDVERCVHRAQRWNADRCVQPVLISFECGQHAVEQQSHLRPSRCHQCHSSAGGNADVKRADPRGRLADLLAYEFKRYLSRGVQFGSLLDELDGPFREHYGDQ